MKFNKIVLFISVLFLVVLLVACQSDSDGSADESVDEAVGDVESSSESLVITGEKPIVTMTMENGDEVVIELYPSIAPNTVNNFISLIEDNFYDGLIFHRVIPGFMVQGGDPDGNGTGGPGYGIKGEFSSNGFDNDLVHDRGVLSMARSQSPDSAGSQFFIMTELSPHLDGDYAAFGKVTEGMDAVDTIVNAEKGSGDKPVEDQVIETMTVDLAGYEFTQPEVE